MRAVSVGLLTCLERLSVKEKGKAVRVLMTTLIRFRR